MSAPQKDGFDIALDFFFGAVFADFWVVMGFLRTIGRWSHVDWTILLIYLVSSTLIAGSLAALFRNQFWSRYNSNSIIPPNEETVSKRSKCVLWILFALGVVSLGIPVLYLK